MNDFVIHACEQALRFSTVDSWGNLSDKLKMQLSFNVGVMALGLDLSKEEGYQSLADVCEGRATITEFNNHVAELLKGRNIEVSVENINKSFEI